MALTKEQGLVRSSRCRAPAVEAIEDLRTLEETRSRDMLIECLQSGIAFHNADMCIEERSVVERHFRQGSIRVICATPTLAVGVNLPVRNVFLEPMLWDNDKATGQMFKRFLTKAEYDNMSGRAGRLSLEDSFGRSVLVATTPLEKTQFERLYFEAELEELSPQLTGVDLETHAMDLVAARAAHSRQDIARFLRHTLTGMRHAKALSDREDSFQEKIDVAVRRCLEHGLLRESHGTLTATSLGRLCAIKGIAAGSGHDIREWLDKARGRHLTEVEAIYAIVRTPEARAQQMNMSTDEYHAWVYPQRLLAALPREAVGFFSPMVDDRIYQTYEDVKARKVALILKGWIEGCRAVEIEEEFVSLAGTIRAAGEMCGWLMDAASAIAELLGFPDEGVRFLRDLSARLEMGVAADGVPLCSVHVRGFGRTHIQKLLNAGVRDMDALRQASEDAIAAAIGKSMGRQVREFLAGGAKQASLPPAKPKASTPASATVPVSPATQEFACQDRLHFDATVRKRRTVIVVNGAREEIPNKTFAMLLRMAIQLREDGVGWVRREEFGENPQQAISNARRDVRPLLADAGAEVLENDGFGSYRLSVPPQNVSFDWEKISDHWDGQIASLGKLV